MANRRRPRPHRLQKYLPLVCFAEPSRPEEAASRCALLGGLGRVCDLNRHQQRCHLCQFLLPTEQNTRRYPMAARHLRKTGARRQHRFLDDPALVRFAAAQRFLAPKPSQDASKSQNSLLNSLMAGGAIVAAWCGTESDSTNPMEIQAIVRDRATMSPNDPPVSTTRNIYREVLEFPRTLRSLAPSVSGCTFNASARSQPPRYFGREILVVVGCQRSATLR
jgi:hypothetical protein